MSSKNEPRLTKAERTAQARETAKKLREAQLKKEKRNSWLIRGGVLAAAVAIVVIIALVVVNTQKNNEPIPAAGAVSSNMNAYGGVAFGANGTLIPPTTTAKTVDIADAGTPPTAQATAATGLDEIGIKASGNGEPVQTVIYFDFMCPFCGDFEKTYGAELKQLASDKKITLEYRALGFLDRFSQGTNYSSRAAAAAACVADQSPDKYQAYLDKLFQNQPKENSKGLNNSQLKDYAKEVGAADIGSCVDAKTYRPFVNFTSALATNHGINSTPSVFMDGEQWSSKESFDDFKTRVLAAKK